MNPENNEKPNQMSNNLRTTPNCDGANEKKIVHDLLLSGKNVLKKLTIKEGRLGLKIMNVTLEILPYNDEPQIQDTSVMEQVVHNSKRKTIFEQESEVTIKKKRTTNNNNSRNSLSSSAKQPLILVSDKKYKQSNIRGKETKSLEKTKNIPRVNQNYKNMLQPDNANIFLQQKQVIRGEILTDTVSPEHYSQCAAQTLKESGTMISSPKQTVETNNTNETNTHEKNELMTTLLKNPHITVTLNKNKNTMPYKDDEPSNIEALNNNAITRNGNMSMNKTSKVVSNHIMSQKRKVCPQRSSVVAKLKKKFNFLPTPISIQNLNNFSSSPKDQMNILNDLQMKNCGSTDHNPAQINLELDNYDKEHARRYSSMARMVFLYNKEK